MNSNVNNPAIQLYLLEALVGQKAKGLSACPMARLK